MGGYCINPSDGMMVALHQRCSGRAREKWSDSNYTAASGAGRMSSLIGCGV